jgi:TolA-binding protein
MAAYSKYTIQTEISQIIENNFATVIGKNNDSSTVIGQQVQNQSSAEALATMSEIFNSLHTITQILEVLQKQNPQATEVEAQTIIEAEFRELQRTGKLATLRKQLLNRERWFNGGKAALTEAAKHYVEGNIIYKAAIAFLEGFSEDEEVGE